MSDIGIYSTTAMLGVLRALRKAQPRWLLDTFFPGMSFSDTEQVAFDVEVEDEEVAPFVSPTSAGQIGSDLGYETLYFTPAYIKPVNDVKPGAPLRRMMGEALGGTLSAGQREMAILGQLLEMQQTRIIRRKLLMGAEVIRTGTCVIKGDDYPEKLVDFRRDAALTKTLAGAARWKEDGVSPYADVQAWIDLVGEKSGAAVTTVVMTGDAWALFEADPKLEKVLDRTLGQAATVQLGVSNGLPGSPVWKGRIGNTDFFTWNDTYREGGVKKTVFPPFTVVLAALGAAEGTQAHGAILDPRAGYRSLEAWPWSWIEDNPPRRMLMTQSAPLVYFRRPNATMCVTVR